MVGTSLNNLALIDDEDLVSIPDGAEPMGDDEAGASAH